VILRSNNTKEDYIINQKKNKKKKKKKSKAKFVGLIAEGVPSL